METFFDWLANGSLPWAAYPTFMPGHLIGLDKQPDVRLVGVGETWRRIFANIMLKATGPKATMTCQDDQLCAKLKPVIYGTVHGVQAIWDENFTTEDWGLLPLDAKTALNKINQVVVL